MPELVVHGFETSNNMKVRVALGYKGLDYEFRRVDPAERSEIVGLSGQHLTPLLVHGDVRLPDSAAILRYLDANFDRGPRLFGASRDEQWEIEDWELFARTRLAGPLMELVHHKVGGGTVDEAMTERCAAAYSAAIRELAARLRGRDSLVGDTLTAADVTAAPVVFRVRSAEMFPFPDDAAAILPWVDRVMAYDRELSSG